MENNSQASTMYSLVFYTFKKTNDYILKKEKEEDLDFIDHYIFQATSYVISIIHDNVYLGSNSLCKMFIYRSLIECVAVINMYLAGDINEESKELINKFCYLAEFSIYKKYKEQLDGKVFFFEQIENNFKETKSIYRENFDELNSVDFKEKIKSSLPFIKEDYSFDDLVQKYCGNIYQYYRLLSVMIHPNDVKKTIMLVPEIQFQQLEVELFKPIVDVITTHYSNVNPLISLTFKEEYNAFRSTINVEYIKAVVQQQQIMYDLANRVQNNFGNNEMSIFLRELGDCVLSMAFDKIFDFPEVVKSKFKMSIEMSAMFYHICLLPHTVEDSYKGELISKHTKIKIAEILDEDTSALWDDAYNCFKKGGENLSFDDFKKRFFSTLGFIPEKTSITNFVYKLIDAVCKENETLDAHMKMVYDESQLLSHANGYMIVANDGAFMEYSSVIGFIDIVIDYLLNIYQTSFKLYKIIEAENKYNKLIYDIEMYRKKYAKLTKEKAKIDKGNKK